MADGEVKVEFTFHCVWASVELWVHVPAPPLDLMATPWLFPKRSEISNGPENGSSSEATASTHIKMALQLFS